MGWLLSRHDLGITNVGTDGAGTTLVGMILAQREDGTPAYEEYDASYLADQFFTNTPSQDYTNPEEEIIMSQHDWRGGFGLDYADPADPTRYSKSIGMDLRFRDMAIQGQKASTISVQQLTWTSPTGHTESADWTNEANIYDDNTATYAYETDVPPNSWSEPVRLSIASCNISGIRIWVSSVGAGGFCTQANVDIYYGSAWHDYYSGTVTEGAWNYYTGIATGVTEMRIYLYNDNDASTANLYLNEVDFGVYSAGGTQTLVTDMVEYRGQLVVAAASTLYQLSSDGASIIPLVTAGSTITDLEVFTGNNLYLACGTTGAYNYLEYTSGQDGNHLLVSTAGTSNYQLFKTVYTTAPTLYANDSVNTLRSTTNPVNGGTAWSATTTVGMSTYSILSLFSKSGALYIRKQDMPYYLSSTGAVQSDLAPELSSISTKAGDKNVSIWLDRIYMPAGPTLLENDSGVNTWLSPSEYSRNLSEFDGDVQATTFDEQWLYGVISNSVKVEVVAGRWEDIDGTRWVWHPIQEVTLSSTAGCTGAWVSNVYQKRLYLASASTADALTYIPLFANYGDVVNDTNRGCSTAGTDYFETPWLHGNFRADNKAWIKLTLTMGHTYSATKYFTAQYKMLASTVWVGIGNYTGSSSSMVESKYIDTTNKPFSSMMKFKFISKTDSATISPILLNYDARAILYPSIKRIIHCVVKCAQEITCKDGSVEKNLYSTIKTTLDNARNYAKWPVSIRDIDGSTVNVKFLPVPQTLRRMMVTKQEKDRKMEKDYHILMMEVNLA